MIVLTFRAMEPRLPADLEGKLHEFLQSVSPMRDVMARIVDWQTSHDAAHRSLSDKLDSHHFRLQALETAMGRGASGLARLVLVIVLSAGVGYAAHAIIAPAGSAARP